jgi:hypothetical protein
MLSMKATVRISRAITSEVIAGFPERGDIKTVAGQYQLRRIQ